MPAIVIHSSKIFDDSGFSWLKSTFAIFLLIMILITICGCCDSDVKTQKGKKSTKKEASEKNVGGKGKKKNVGVKMTKDDDEEGSVPKPSSAKDDQAEEEEEADGGGKIVKKAVKGKKKAIAVEAADETEMTKEAESRVGLVSETAPPITLGANTNREVVSFIGNKTLASDRTVAPFSAISATRIIKSKTLQPNPKTFSKPPLPDMEVTNVTGMQKTKAMGATQLTKATGPTQMTKLGGQTQFTKINGQTGFTKTKPKQTIKPQLPPAGAYISMMPSSEKPPTPPTKSPKATVKAPPNAYKTMAFVQSNVFDKRK